MATRLSSFFIVWFRPGLGGTVLIDRAEIYVRAGKGGDGCLSFRRERFISHGGPDGGAGGDGGSVYAVAFTEVETLLDFSGRHHWIAENGQPGRGSNRTGRSGAELILELPVGTQIFDRDTDLLLKDLSTANERVCVAEGGQGGRGNAGFARPTHQTPREFEEGLAGTERWLRLELKLIADVGVVGLPNAGKSTLLSRLSKARPKIADYPFTTLQPQLGIVELSDHRRFVMADIPGLIEGAHEGVGLGDAFLRHIERTRVILTLIDVGFACAPVPPIEAYATIRTELEKYSPELAAKPELVVANKIDLPDAVATASEFSRAIDTEVLLISAVTGKGLSAMSEKLWQFLCAAKQPESAVQPAPKLPERDNS